jgi:hypothetical protein
MRNHLSTFRPYYVLVLLIGLVLWANLFAAQNQPKESAESQATESNRNLNSSLDKILAVLRSPRCMNCHPSGDRPRQGDEMKFHNFGVLRGADNQGGPVQTCNTCHQSENNVYSNVPSAPHWGLAPKSMGWIGLSDTELMESILDRSKNGNRSPEEIVEHMSHDALVLWAWNPGSGRTPPPVDVNDFRKALADWLAEGTPVSTKTNGK